MLGIRAPLPIGTSVMPPPDSVLDGVVTGRAVMEVVTASDGTGLSVVVIVTIDWVGIDTGSLDEVAGIIDDEVEDVSVSMLELVAEGTRVAPGVSVMGPPPLVVAAWVRGGFTPKPVVTRSEATVVANTFAARIGGPAGRQFSSPGYCAL